METIGIPVSKESELSLFLKKPIFNIFTLKLILTNINITKQCKRQGFLCCYCL